MNNHYLTEQTLSILLNDIYPFKTWLHDKCFVGRTRPDYRCDELKLIVEFDGYQHYTSAARILDDIIKDKSEEAEGYKVIRIPYFVQPSSLTVKMLFGIASTYQQQYPHGFIDKKCILPADYCQLGIDKFKTELDNKFSYIKSDIIASIEEKIEACADWRYVLPECLHYLVDKSKADI